MSRAGLSSFRAATASRFHPKEEPCLPTPKTRTQRPPAAPMSERCPHLSEGYDERYGCRGETT